MPEQPAKRPLPGESGQVFPADASWRVVRFAELDSTNRLALDEARAGAEAGLVVVADVQTAGRGRLGRTWQAPPGASLLVSVLLRPDLPPSRLTVLTMAAALAMADALEDVAGIEPELKWPNDLLVGGRKLCGILSEADTAPDGSTAVVVGLGVNVRWEEFPGEIARTATALNLVSPREVTRDALLDAFLDRFGARLGSLDEAATDYRARLATIGRRVRVEQADETYEALAAGVDDDGSLHVRRDDGRDVVLRAGDVIHLRS
jgi:BirA family biotin operon repressor/biotin-[acetyl-CoA-carboxylase] ligase